MYIKSISLKNFRRFTEKELTLNEDIVEFYGQNGAGKSTIGHAIAWCITGCELFGNSRYTSKLKNDDCDPRNDTMGVSIEFEVDGEEYFVMREDNPITAYVNGYESSSITMEIWGITEDEFLALFNPRYFTQLSPKDAKALLKKSLKRINIKELYDELTEHEKNIIGGHTKINSKIKEARKDIKEYKESVVYLEGKMSNLEQQEVPKKVEFEKQKELDDFIEKKELLEEPTRQETDRLIEFKKTLKKLKNTNFEKPNLDGLKEKYRVKTLNLEKQKSDVDSIQEELKNVEDNIGQHGYNIAVLEQQLESLEERKENAKNVECPNCGFEFKVEGKTIEEKIKSTKEEIKKANEILNSFEENKEGILKKIDTAEKYNTAIDVKKDVLDKEFDKELEEKMANYYNKIDQLDEKIAKYEQYIEEEQETIEAQYLREKDEYKNTLRNLNNKIELLKDEKRKVQSTNEEVERIKKQNESIEKDKKEIELQIDEEKKKIQNLKNKVDLLKNFNVKIVEKQTEALNDSLDNVEIQMQKVNYSTGEVKSVFYVKYKGRDYDLCSGGEKIKIGFEIARMIGKQKMINIPLFLDDAERLTIPVEFERKVQLIKTYVKEGVETIEK